MPEKQQPMSSFAANLGARVSQANAEHKDKPVDVSDRRLPAGIKNGVAKISAMYTKKYDDKSDTKGQTFFRASAIVMSPEVHNGEKVAGQITQIIIPMCDVPAKGERKAKPFSENFYEFQNLFKLLGVAPCPETPTTDLNGLRTEAYFFAAMKSLTDPKAPVYVGFQTRGWTPKATVARPKPEEMVFEDWTGRVEWNGQHDPAGAVAASGPAGVQPDANSSPPPAQAPATRPAASQAPPQAAPAQAPASEEEVADVVAALVETAVSLEGSEDPALKEESRLATVKLEEMAWAKGWSKEQTGAADGWAQVGDMALEAPQAAPAALPAAPTANPTPGSRWMYAKRAKSGQKLANDKGVAFPPVEVEVVAVDEATKTCTVRGVKDGKDIIDIRSKKPVAVKFEWLERDLKI
jgi:hypothetical protein